MSSTPTNRQQRGFVPLYIWAGMAASILFVVVFTIDGFLKSGYSAMSEAVSYLALGDYGWVQDVNFFILGVALMLYALGFRQVMQPIIVPPWLQASVFFLVLVGVGYFMASLFVAAAPGESGTELHSVMHTVAFETVFFAQAIACFIIGWQLSRTAGWRGYGWYTLVTGLITIFPAIANLVFSFATTPQGQSYAGLFNRILIIEALAWYLVTGSRILSGVRATERTL